MNPTDLKASHWTARGRDGLEIEINYLENKHSILGVIESSYPYGIIPIKSDLHGDFYSSAVLISGFMLDGLHVTVNMALTCQTLYLQLFIR